MYIFVANLVITICKYSHLHVLLQMHTVSQKLCHLFLQQWWQL